MPVPSPLGRKFCTREVARFLSRFTSEDEYERCAVILGGPQILLYEIPNISEYTEGYAIAGSDVKDALRATQRPLMGYLHTHMPKHAIWPSAWDMEDCDKHPELVYAVYHTERHVLVLYQNMDTYYRLEVVPVD